MSYTPSLETQLADLRESWRNLVHQRDEQGERIATLEQQLAAMQAERNEARGEAAMALAECDAMQFRLTQVGRERDAARAALRLLRNGIAEAAICLTEPLDMLPCLTPERRIKAAADTLESLLADPQGQQAAAEWQRLQRIEQVAQQTLSTLNALIRPHCHYKLELEQIQMALSNVIGRNGGDGQTTE